MGSQEIALIVSKLDVVYNRIIVALHNISFTVKEKEIISILGRNGAGKTTTLRAISGFFKSEGISIRNGDLLWCGNSLKGKMPFEIVRSGVVLVPEREKIFETLVRRNTINMHCPAHSAGVVYSTDSSAAIQGKIKKIFMKAGVGK